MNHTEKSLRYGLILALAENMSAGDKTQSRPLPQGRLKSLCSRLKSEAESRLASLPRLTDDEVRGCQEKYIEFAKRTGWQKKNISALTFANFLLEMLDKAPSDFDRSISIIRDIVEYFERAGNAKAPQYWAASNAAEAFLL